MDAWSAFCDGAAAILKREEGMRSSSFACRRSIPMRSLDPVSKKHCDPLQAAVNLGPRLGLPAT
jgi:hypothetical protein